MNEISRDSQDATPAGQAPDDPRVEAAANPRFVARFETKHMPEPNSGCWIWDACRNSDGYGQIRITGRMEKAHRISWLLYRGELPTGAQILHRCDTPSCVNPAHLFLGSHTDNMRDMAAKGRGSGWPDSTKFRPKPHCVHGHEFTEENTRHYVRDGRKRRECKTCRTAYEIRRGNLKPRPAPPAAEDDGGQG